MVNSVDPGEIAHHLDLKKKKKKDLVTVFMAFELTCMVKGIKVCVTFRV